MITAELFCGTKSFSNVARERGHSIFTVDIDNSFMPDLCKDILDVIPSDLPKDIDVLWASPPCQCFSVASIGCSWHHQNYCPRRSETALGMAYVLKTIELIRTLKPHYWFIENPRGLLRKMAFMDGFHRVTVTYCQYGDSRMKPTDIWNNLLEWIPRQACKNNDPCHEPAPRGSRTGTQARNSIDRGKVPSQLINEIFDVIDVVM